MHLAIGYRDEIKGLSRVGQAPPPRQDGASKRPNTGPMQVSPASNRSPSKAVEKSPRGIRDGGARYHSGGWDELAAASARGQHSRVQHPAQWGANKVAKQEDAWALSALATHEEGASGRPILSSSKGFAGGKASLHGKPLSMTPQKPGGGSARGTGPSPRTSALRTWVAASSSAQVGGIIGATREGLMAQILRCVSEPDPVLQGRAGEDAGATDEILVEQRRGGGDNDDGARPKKMKTGRLAFKAAKHVVSLSTGPKLSSGDVGARQATPRSDAQSSRRSTGMGLWGGVFGTDKDEGEPSRVIEGYTSKLKTKVHVMSEAVYLTDKKFQRRRSSVMQSRRGSLISNASDDKTTDKPNMASVVLDHIQHCEFSAAHPYPLSHSCLSSAPRSGDRMKR